MLRHAVVFLSVVALAGCEGFGARLMPGQTEAPAPAGDEVPPDATQAPETTPRARPPEGARTADEFDTSSDTERASAVAEASSGAADRDLGLTVASLGAVGEGGMWLKTPLVSSPVRGRVEYPAKGTRVAVDLIPIEGEPGSGSRLSLAAMRLIEADLTALPELRVFVTD